VGQRASDILYLIMSQQNRRYMVKHLRSVNTFVILVRAAASGR
jgi:hypothetical protein